VKENLQHVLNSAVQRWHFRMLNDARRNAAYAAAIQGALAGLPNAPGSAVLDIGTGTGLLGMLAARSGAGHVWACDCSPVMAALARHCTAANGLAQRVSGE
jgi:predicted RNA methylase